jgi:hypothetical protein
MAGQVHQLIEQIITQRSKGNAALAATTRTKLLLKGIDPDKFTAMSADDPTIVARVRQVAVELNVAL